MSDEENTPLEAEDKDKIFELIKDALNENIANQKEFKSASELRDILSGIIAEYLDSFIIMGYDFNGREVVMEGARSTQQKDALDTLFLRLVRYKMGYEPSSK